MREKASDGTAGAGQWRSKKAMQELEAVGDCKKKMDGNEGWRYPMMML